MAAKQFSIDNFVARMTEMHQVGPMPPIVRWLLRRILGPLMMDEVDVDREVRLFIAIYRAMTVAERAEPDIMVRGRRHRVARGAGVSLAEVNQFFTQYETMRRTMMSDGSPCLQVNRPLALVGLVTENKYDRDPTYLYRWGKDRDHLILVILIASALALLALLNLPVWR